MIDMLISNSITVTKLILTSVAILVSITLIIGVLVKSYHNNPALGVIYLKFITGLVIIALVWRVKTLGVEWNSIWLFIAFFVILVLSLIVIFASATLFARSKRTIDQVVGAVLFIVAVLIAFVSGHGLYWVLSTIFQR